MTSATATTHFSGDNNQGFQLANNPGSVSVIFNRHSESQRAQLARLPQANGAAFNSYDCQHRPQCLPDTRTKLREHIIRWAKDCHSERIFWLYGMAGTGKSTVAYTIAHALADQNCLGGSFFFSRGAGDRGRAAKFFTTLAAQLANALPAVAPYICEAAAEIDIAGQALSEQIKKLIYQPLSKLGSDLSPPQTVVLVVDALDECEREDDVRLILRLLAEAEEINTVCLRIFMTSRPELPIRLGFRAMPEILHQDLGLHDTSQSIIEIEHDIFVFIKNEFVRISEERSLPADFLDERNIKLLVQNASGLFIYAATACRFIGDLKWLPQERLLLILQGHTGGQSPARVLDKLYIQVLNQSLVGEYDEQETEELAREFRQIVGSIIVLVDSLSPAGLAGLLAMSKEVIDLRLDHLRSILDVSESFVRPLHPSFCDFLLDKQRCSDRQFWVDETAIHKDLTESCLLLMSNKLHKDICNLKLPGALTNDINSSVVDRCLSIDVQYACCYWVHHLQRSNTTLNDGGRVHIFLQEHFLHWLEALSLMRNMSGGVIMVIVLESLLMPKSNTTSPLLAMIQDAKRFILYNRSIIERAPLQVYASALVFSPKTSLIRRQFSSQGPAWIKSLLDVEENWSPSLQTLEGHSGWVLAVAFSPDRKWLASASVDKTVRLWDAETGALQQMLKGHSDSVNSVTFSRNGRRLASASDDETVRLWDAETGALQQTLEGHCDSVKSVTFSHDGQRLASASDDGTVRLWDAETGALQQELKLNDYDINSVMFSPNGRLLASASDDETVRLWDAKTGALQQTLMGHYDRVKSVTFSYDGQRLASASDDETVRLWDAKTGALQQTLLGDGPIYSVTFSCDGRWLASASFNKTVQLWDAKTGALQQTLVGHDDPVTSVTFLHDGRQLASASNDKTVRLWDAETKPLRQMLMGHYSSVNSVTFSRDRQRLASASDDTTVRLWDVETGALQQTLLGHNDPINLVTFSRNGQRLASASDDKTVRIWDAETGALQQTLEGHRGTVNSVTFSRNGQRLASASIDETVRLWDTKTGALQQTLEGHRGTVHSVTFSRNGRQLASTSTDKTVRLWDAETGALQQTLVGHSGSVYQVTFSRDGRRLASASIDETVRLWDAETGALQQTFEIGSATQLSFNNNGLRLYTDIGCIDLGLPFIGFVQTLSHSSYRFAKDRSWITWNNHNVLWLPKEYRPSCLMIKDNTLAMGHLSGRVTIVRFQSGVSPTLG